MNKPETDQEPHQPTATEQAKMSLHAQRAKQLEASRVLLLAGSLAREAAEPQEEM
jgi:fructose-1-phosphate kinase PfkB-like protein